MNMKTRMTITIEPEVSHRAKSVARAREPVSLDWSNRC